MENHENPFSFCKILRCQVLFMAMEILLTTIFKRPYVVVFFLSYVFIAWRVTNAKWMALHIISAYFLAFLSEYGSINYGFPYGWYFYIYENLQGEWLFQSVPVWDSASYIFMCFAGLCAARVHMRGIANLNQINLVLLSAFYTTLLDVIIDPVAHMGDRWFLGQIYYYPDPGFYFDITMANFAGWFLTSLTINSVGVFVWKFETVQKLSNPKTKEVWWNRFFALGLYFGIMGFGLCIAIDLQEWLLVACDLGWIIFVGYLIWNGFGLAVHK